MLRNVPQFLLNLLILSSLNLYRNVFVFQMELWIPPFKGSMSQPASSMFVAGEIKQNCGTSFYGHPVPTELHPLKPLIFLPFLFKSASTVQGVKMAKKVDSFSFCILLSLKPYSILRNQFSIDGMH